MFKVHESEEKKFETPDFDLVDSIKVARKKQRYQ